MKNHPPAERYRVYWIPGCSSCLKLKEFVTKQGIPFVSINALEHENAWKELEEMGCKGFPVLARGREFVVGQTLEPVIKFLKCDVTLQKLSMPQMMDRMFYFLDAAARLSGELPPRFYDYQPVAGRDRSLFKLACHAVQVADAFIETVAGGSTDLMALFEAPPPAEVRSGAQIASYAASVEQRIRDWWVRQDQANPKGSVETFYGEQSILDFAERSTWHCAQHVRQLEVVLDDLKVPLSWRIDARNYDGLPMPDGLWA